MRETDISILGTTYKLKIGTREELKDLDADCQGICNKYKKEILITTDVDEKENWSEEEKKVLFSNTFMHEISHAYLIESGRTALAEDEEFVEYFSVICRKMELTVVDTKIKLKDLFL